MDILRHYGGGAANFLDVAGAANPERVAALLDRHGANIVRVDSGKVEGAAGNQYIAVFAISLRDETALNCRATIVHTAGELKLSFRYETA